MAAPLTLMLKTIVLPEKLTSEQLKIGDGEVNRFGIGSNIEHTKKSKKMSKSRNLIKSRKKVVKKWEFN